MFTNANYQMGIGMGISEPSSSNSLVHGKPPEESEVMRCNNKILTILGENSGENLWEKVTGLGVCFGENNRDYQKKIKDMMEAESERTDGGKMELQISK